MTLTPKQRMAQTLVTKRGRELYARRKVIVEPVFGQIKASRSIRDFLLRGASKVSAEWGLITATHNLRKLYTVAPGSFRGAGAVFAGG